MCGILGICGQEDVAGELLQGLTAIQHRGQDAAGVVTLDKLFSLRKGLGLLSQVFGDVTPADLPGRCGLGHVRYATIGSNDVLDAQPIVANYPFGMAMVHNGNVVNFAELRRSMYDEHHRLLETSNDVALILYTFASELETKNLKALTPGDIFDAVTATQHHVLGAYSAICIIANVGFLAFSDPYGIRPIVMGRKYAAHGIEYVYASESVCLDFLGCERVCDLAPGEAIFIDMQQRVHRRICRQEQQAFCVFEYIYFAREDSIIHDRLVAHERLALGRRLAARCRARGLHPDIVIDVPSSSYFFAAGLSEALGVPYRRGLAKNNHIGRSFLAPTKETRELLVRQKLNPIAGVVAGAKVAVVDDSIVRGTTSKYLVTLLRKAGATEVYFLSAAPPIRFPCVYGIDMSVRREIIAAHYSLDQIHQYLAADAVLFQELDDLQDLYKDLPCCFACFTGIYPTGVSAELLAQIEQERVCSMRL
jgi:amidophosphoribosyltransferase